MTTKQKTQHQAQEMSLELTAKSRKDFLRILTSDIDDHILIKPFCDFFGIDYRHQRKNTQLDPIIAQGRCFFTHPKIYPDGQKYVALSKKAFVRWVQLINANTVKPALKDKLILFQAHIFDFIYGKYEHYEAQIKEEQSLDLRIQGVLDSISTLQKEKRRLIKEKDRIRSSVGQLTMALGGQEGDIAASIKNKETAL